MRASTFWLWPILVLLTGCAAISRALPPPPDPNALLIGPGQQLNLPRAADLGRSILATQLITITGYGQTFVLQVNLSVTPDRVTLVGLDAMGRRAMTITLT